MPHVVKDRVKETSTTVGTSTLVLAGAVSGFQSFSSAIGNGNTTYYAIDGGAEWEVGIGTVGAGSLSRDTVLESSNSGSLVNFSTGTKNVFCTYPAEKSVDIDTAQTLTNKTITSGTIDNTPIGATTASTGRFTTLASTQQTSLATSSGNVQVGATTATEKLDISGGGLLVRGSTNQTANNGGLYLGTTGTNSALTAINPSVQWFNMNFAANQFSFLPQNAEQFRISHTASSVNYVQVTGASTTGSPSISAQGSDSTINFDIAAKGGGEIRFKPNGATTAVNFAVAFTANTVNYLTATGSGASGNAPRLYPQGSDTNISMAFQPKGTGAINLAAGSSGVNISNGGTVTAITRTALGTAYTSPPTVNISAPTTAGGVQATATVPLQQISPLTIVSGGTGYTVGDTLTISGGTFTVRPTMTVATVSGGVITSITQVNYGVGTVIPSNPMSVTGGTGTGATFSTTAWGISAVFTITNAGSGYIEQPTVTFSGGGGSGAAAYATVGSPTIFRSLGGAGNSAQSMSFYSSSGETLRLATSTTGGTSANYVTIASGATGNGSRIKSDGSDTNIFLGFETKGTGAFQFITNNASEQLRVSHTASAVNFVQVTGNATTGNPTISAQGSDTNIGVTIAAKGNGSSQFFANGGTQLRIRGDIASPTSFIDIFGSTSNAPILRSTGANLNIQTTTGNISFQSTTAGTEQFRVLHVASAVNYVQAQGSSTGNQPFLWVGGSDTNIALGVSSKGNGAVNTFTNGGGNLQFAVSHTASAVNYVQVTGGATGSAARISTQGSDGTVGFGISAKGGAQIFFQNNGSSNTSLVLNGGTSTVNYLQINATNTTLAPSVQAQGTDTNIDLALTPKGTGLVRFGTYTNTVSTIAGYIEIRDAGGTIRRLAVVS